MAEAGLNAFVSKTAGLQRLLEVCRKYLAGPDATNALSDSTKLSARRFAELQRGYVRRIGLTVGELRRSLNSGDQETMLRLTHQMMGTSALYGLDAVGQAARAINDALRSGRSSKTFELLMRVLEQRVALSVRQFGGEGVSNAVRRATMPSASWPWVAGFADSTDSVLRNR
jgi:HPt (histidine-containing phosphotransfer) domain-containing protein